MGDASTTRGGRRPRRSNAARARETRDRLVAAARPLFAENGYAETGTPEIVAAAGVTRGALYHHFTDKRDLFRAVLEAEQQALARRIDDESGPLAGDPIQALMAGTRAFLAVATDPGANRILFVDGPAVLGWGDWRDIDDRFSGATLREGLAFAMAAGVIRDLPLDALTGLLSAAFNEAALGLGGPSPRYARDDLETSFRALFEGLAP